MSGNTRCPKCKSNRVVKIGSVMTVKSGKKRRLKCQNCGATFYERR